MHPEIDARIAVDARPQEKCEAQRSVAYKERYDGKYAERVARMARCKAIPSTAITIGSVDEMHDRRVIARAQATYERLYQV